MLYIHVHFSLFNSKNMNLFENELISNFQIRNKLKTQTLYHFCIPCKLLGHPCLSFLTEMRIICSAYLNPPALSVDSEATPGTSSRKGLNSRS